MKKFIIVYYIFCMMVLNVQAEQFLYPVADLDHGDQLVIIYQKSLDDIELWFLNRKDETVTRGLSSFLTPANFRVLPSGNGFSFIDCGYIKIKYFVKRSPKTLGIYEPISLFSSMNWIDDHTFYFTAREGDFYQVFQGDDEANIQRISCEPVDFLYPSKIGDNLYCIKRDLDCNFTIIKQPWHPVSFSQHQIASESIILSETDKPLCFLHMVSDQQGFYLQAPEFKGLKDDEIYEFICHHLIQIDNKWISDKLFSFMVPLKYINGSTRLYESIEPFLPNYSMKDYVYFSTYNKNNDSFELFNIQISTKAVTNLTDCFIKKNGASNNQLFAPYIYGSQIYCGIIMHDTRVIDFTQLISMFELPIIDVK